MENKITVHNLFRQLNDNGKKKLKSILLTHFSEDVTIEITDPYIPINGVEDSISNFWHPLFHSFPDVEFQPYILVGGDFERRGYASCTGNMVGTFTESWLDIPATNQPTWLRFAGHFMFEKDKIVKAWFFFDMLDVMRQAGFVFFPSKGKERIAPAPMTGDGLVLYETDAIEGKKTLNLTNDMLNGLGNYDGKTLESMGQKCFWDIKNMMWYGPSGIGTTRGLEGFQRNHQVPFITAFPDRGITEKVGKDYFTQIGDGNYSCDFGFPAMYGTHLNDGWLGLKATKKNITLRVVDYWRREGDKLKENWVFIDMPHVLKQLGIDVFKLLKEKQKSEQCLRID